MMCWFLLSSTLEKDEANFVFFNLDVSVWIILLTLLSVGLILGIDKIVKIKNNILTEKKLVIEIRYLYRTVCLDILKYKSVKESRYSKALTVSSYTFPVMRKTMFMNNFHHFFKGEDYVICLNIYTLLSQLENVNKNGFDLLAGPISIDWFYKNRLRELRSEFLKLAQNGILISDLQANKDIDLAVTEFINSLN